MTLLAAARAGDPLQHTKAAGGFLGGLLMGAVVGALLVVGAAAVAAATVATGGAVLLAGPLVTGAVIAGMACLGASLGEAMGGMKATPAGSLQPMGSPDVSCNGRPAVRAHVDQGQCSQHALQRVAQGSASVLINGMPAARVTDALTCSATIAKGSPNVRIGGGTRTTDDIEPEVPEWAHWTLAVVGLASGFVLCGFSITLVAVGVGGSLLGSVVGASIGRGYGGEGSKSEFWGGLLGSLLGGVAGTKGGVFGLKHSPGLARMDAAARPWACRTLRLEPVDVVTGEMVMRQVDFELPGSLGLSLNRVHVSGHRAGRLFGPAWMSTWDARLVLEGDTVRHDAGDGSVQRFPLPAPGAESRPERGERHVLRRVQGGFVLAQAGGLHVFFESHGHNEARLGAAVDANGQWLAWRYADNGDLIQVEHSGGYRLSIQNEAGRVVAISLDNAPEDGSDTARTVLMRYRYDAGDLAAVINGSGLPLTYAYDAAGRIRRWQDRRGTWFAYEYDAQGRCVQVGGVDGLMQARIAYDPQHRVNAYEEADGRITTFHYNERQLVTREIDALGGIRETHWDDNDRKVWDTDPLGRVTRYEYDVQGRLVCLTQPDDSSVVYGYDEQGRCTQITDPLGGSWKRRYDERGRLLEAEQPDGAITGWAYDERGQVARIRDALGQERRFEHDARGLLMAVSSSAGHVTRFERDALGRVVRQTDALGGTTRYGYDAMGLVTERIGPDGATERWTHDAEGVLASHTDALGRVTRFETGWFDKAAGELRTDGSRVRYRHDANLRMQTVIDPLGQRWHYEFDALGRVVAETDFNDRRIEYRLDAAGQCIASTNALGEVTRYDHDLAGRVVRQSTAEGTSTFSYDKAGHLLTACNQDARVEFERDALGRVVRETVDGRSVSSRYDLSGRRTHRTLSGWGIGSAVQGSAPGAELQDHESTWTYDACGLPAGVRLPGGHALDFVRDALGREAEQRFSAAGLVLRQTRTYDPAGRLARLAVHALGAWGDRRVQDRGWKYDMAGNLKIEVDLAFGSTSYSLDAGGRVTHAVRSLGSKDRSERYAYDASGNPIEAQRELPLLASTAARRSAEGRRHYRGSRLQAAGAVRYEHDRQGRVTSRTEPGGRVWRYAWTAEDRLSSITTPDGALWRYGYDALGRRVSKRRVEPAAVRSTEPGPPRGTERCAEDIRFVWDEHVLAQEIAVQPGAGSGGDRDPLVQVTTWDCAPGSFIPLTQALTRRQGSKTTRAVHATVLDAIGTPKELVGIDGRIEWQASTTLWGELDEVLVADVTCPIGFQGQYRDAESGLAYNWHRYYDPATGRYQSSDPIQLEGGLHPHGYVSNPTRFVDPFGLTDCKPDPNSQPQARAGRLYYLWKNVPGDIRPGTKLDPSTYATLDGYVEYVITSKGLVLGESHSFLADGKPVRMAGTALIKPGMKVVGMNTRTGHYQTSPLELPEGFVDMNTVTREAFEAAGFDVEGDLYHYIEPAFPTR